MATIKEQAIKKILESNDAEVKELLNGSSSISQTKKKEIFEEMKLRDAMDLIAHINNEDEFDSAIKEINKIRGKWREQAIRAKTAREGRKKKGKESETPKKEPEAEKK